MHLLDEHWERDFNALSLEVSDTQLQSLQAYLGLLQRWNKTYNLTAIRDPKTMITAHIMDSLAVAPYFDAMDCLDVGSGAGLPGIPLAILFPRALFTLLDTNGKKTRFMQQAAIELGLQNIIVAQARTETWQPGKQFDCIISRAFSSIESFVAGTSQHLSSCSEATANANGNASGQRAGRMLAMKGKYPAEELECLPAGFCVTAKHELHVPGLDAERHLIEIAADTSRPA